MSKKAATAGAGAGTASKTKGKGKDVADGRVKEECVASIVDLLFTHLDQHINDKLIFPQTLAHAVARTMAEMVHMVSIAHVQRMEDWLVHLEGSAPEEWDKPQEPLIPLIDSWARGVIPLKTATSSRCSSIDPSQQQEEQVEENVKQPRRPSTMALCEYQDRPPRRRSSNANSRQGLRGSLRRFSESLYPLDPNRKVKFQEKTQDEMQKDTPPSRRSSTPPPTDLFQGFAQDKRNSLVNQEMETNSKISPLQEDKGGKSNKAKASNSMKR